MDNKLEKIGIDVDILRIIAALKELTEDEKAHQIDRSAYMVDDDEKYYKSMMDIERIFAGLAGLNPAERDQLIQTAIDMLETLKIPLRPEV